MLNKALFILILMTSFTGAAMNQDIVKEISTCPSSPNCISSLTSSKKHFMEPWSFNGEMAAVKETLKQKILSFSRVELKSEGEDYIHFVFTSLLLRFKDDLWFSFDEKNKVINFKSASRTGRSDFGVNKKRMLELKGMIF